MFLIFFDSGVGEDLWVLLYYFIVARNWNRFSCRGFHRRAEKGQHLMQFLLNPLEITTLINPKFIGKSFTINFDSESYNGSTIKNWNKQKRERRSRELSSWHLIGFLTAASKDLRTFTGWLWTRLCGRQEENCDGKSVFSFNGRLLWVCIPMAFRNNKTKQNTWGCN